MPRTRVLWISVLAAIAGMGLADAAPASAAGGCSPASAPRIAPGTTQSSDPAACPGGIEYWAMSLQNGDTLTVNGTPMPSSTSKSYMDLDIYGPNLQTIGGQPLCSSDINSSPFTETCVIPATGTYLLVNDAGPGQLTPMVSSAPASSRTAGGCASTSAPNATPDVTQYTNSQVCQSEGGRQYWAMKLQIGDTLTVSGTPTPSSGGKDYMDLDIYGPNVQTIGASLCSSDINSSPFTETCVIPATGTYLLVSDAGSGQFTPTVSSASASSRRIAGGCDSSSAPNAAAGVTQYTNSQLCQAVGGRQYWAMNLQVGDTLTVNGVPISSSGGKDYVDLDIYGPNVQTIGQPRCSSDINSSPFAETCAIPATGRYLLVSDAGSGRFTPRVNHPLLAALQRAFARWSPFARSSVLHVHASSSASVSVCVLIVLGWRTPPRGLSCAHSRHVVLATGRRVFTRAGSASIVVRFTSRARRLLASRRFHRVTLITIYTQRHHGPVITGTRVSFRPR